MQGFDFGSYPIGVNFLIFSAAAGMVWIAGARLARYADQIARATGIGSGIIGLVLLGGITSLPEIAVGVFAAYSGTPALAVNNLLGGIAMQKAILAGVDGFIGREALTVIAATPGLLLQGAFSTLLLVIVAVAIVTKDYLVGGAGLWSWALLLAYGFSVWKISVASSRLPWQLREGLKPAEEPAAPVIEEGARGGRSLRGVARGTIVAALVILAAGFALSSTADAIADQSGLGANFIGAALLALATSLPELSTVIAAMRLRRYEMAIADIMGTSMFNVMLIFLVDAVYRGPPVLSLAGDFSLLAALLCILMAMIYLIGLVERNNRTIARFGVDSLVILAVYAGGMMLLFQLR
ncbi:sodium:calcium antiporter [Massilia sp. GCM10020059]|uniref:Sodium/calcium exchanger membrane region domain-containing protein n=1 Tax=Massilia agrisoli TaxID=2892444 RepID=A0ABS8IQY5_9BURK|nr:hypothetical protein [Massilia agrisoli]MCC6070821.1 hypothetical protein [Massilia agrisoli]